MRTGPRHTLRGKRHVDPALNTDMTEEYPVGGLPTPDPSYGPGAVVDEQLSALARNDDPFADAGVKTAYNFASPANRRATGPVDRFVAMVHGHPYSPMVDHEEAVTGPVERDGDSATRRVTLTGPGGRTVTYEFGLSRAQSGPFADCWLTDRVRVV
jgi:hypothetical protein